MVAYNPLFRGRWTVKRFKAMVINDIWPETLFFTLVATMVSAVSKLTPHQLTVPSGLLTVLGTVLGLVISFRTSSAYEGYQEGRKMWTNIVVTSRNLATLIWLHVPLPADHPVPDILQEQAILRAVIEKKTMINLIQAFVVSVKHFLRGEPGVYYTDLYPLLSFLPRYTNQKGDHTDAAETDLLPLWSAADEYEQACASKRANPRSAANVNGHHPRRTSSEPIMTYTSGDAANDDKNSSISWFRSWSKNNTNERRPRSNDFDPEKVLPEVDSPHDLKPARSPPESSVYDYIPVFRFFGWIFRVIMRRAQPQHVIEAKMRRKRLEQIESNVPMEICFVLSSYAAQLAKNEIIQPHLATAFIDNIAKLQETLSNLERIRNTPLPFAYQAHLRMSLWIYLLFLPFQIYNPFGWFTIPGTAFTSFLLLGFLEIGQEIENPFNYDLNDLDLDHFCLTVQRELHEITAYVHHNPSTFVFSSRNQPFAPSDRRHAEDLLKNPHYQASPHVKDTNPGIASVRRTLVDSWRIVNRDTRDPKRSLFHLN